MAQIVSYVKAIRGTVIARTKDGEQRVLKLGDAIYANEFVDTGKDGYIELTMGEEAPFIIRQQETVQMAESLNPASDKAESADEAVVASSSSELDSILQQIADGADPSTLLAATAAGGSGGGGGHSFVRLTRVSELIENPEQTQVDPIVAIQPLSFPTIVFGTNQAPVASDQQITVDEDGSVNGSINAIDPDGNPLTYTMTTPPSNGLLVINADGSYVYTPNGNFNGNDRFIVEVSDGLGGFTNVTVNVVVNAVNDTPVAQNDAITTNEDTTVTINVLANDSDVDGDVLTVTSASVDPAQGTVTINADGTLNFIPAANFNGAALITYSISDGNGGTSTATVSVTVNPVNDAPVAVNDTATTNEDTAVTINVLANDSDVDGDILTVTSASVDPAQGTVTINADGTLNFIPAANFNGTALITYTVSDGNGGTSSATVNVTVNAINDAPVAVNDSAATNEDTAVTINVLANDTDVDGDVLVVSSASAANGTVLINVDGTITYTPNNNFNGIDTITYQISDGNGGFSMATVAVTVAAVNEAAMIAGQDSGATQEDNAALVSGTLTISDEDGAAEESFNPQTNTTGTYGSFSLSSAGVWDYQLNNAQANVQALAAGQVVTDSFTVSSVDGTTHTVTVTITGTNDAPVVSAPVNLGSISEDDTGLLITSAQLLANASDVDVSDVLSIQNISLTSAAMGTLTNNGDDTWTYVPAADFNGPVSFTYSVFDGTVTTAASANLSVTAQGDAPVISGDTAGSVTEDVNVILATNTISTSGSLVVNDPDAGESGTQAANFVGSYGNFSIDGNGNWSYVANNSQAAIQTLGVGQTLSESFTVLTIDGTPQTINLTINGTNDAPFVSAPINLGSVNESASVTISTVQLLSSATDIDASDVLSINSLSLANPSAGNLVNNGDGTWTFAPTAGSSGNVTFNFNVSDGLVNVANTASIAVTDTTATSAPTVHIIEDSNNDGFINAAELLGGIDIQIGLPSEARAGDVLNVLINGVTSNITLTSTDIGNGFYNFSAANPGEGVTLNVSATITDAAGNVSTAGTDSATIDTQVATLGVTLSNDSGTSNADLITNDGALSITGIEAGAAVQYSIDGGATWTNSFTPIEGANTVSVRQIDTAGNTSASSSISFTLDTTVAAPTVALTNDTGSSNADFITSNGALTIGNTEAGAAVQYSIDGGATWTNSFTPIEGANTVSVRQIDTAGNTSGASSISFTLDTTATAAPIVTIMEDTNNNGYISASELSGAIDIRISVPAGTVTGNVLTVTVNGTPQTVTLMAAHISAGFVDFTTANPGEGATLTVTATVTDAAGNVSAPGSDSAIIDTIAPVVTVSTIAGDNIMTDYEDDSVTLSGTATGASGQTINVQITNPSGVVVYTGSTTVSGAGTWSIAGLNLSALPDNLNYNVTATVSDAAGNVGSGSRSFLMQDSPPIAVNDTATTNEDTAVNVNVLANDSDVDGEALTVISATAAIGSVSINLDGSLRYTPPNNWSGTTSISYTIRDSYGSTATATVSVTVNAVADMPILAVPTFVSAINASGQISTTAEQSQASLESLLGLTPGVLDTFNPPPHSSGTPNHAGNVNVIDGQMSSYNYTLQSGQNLSFNWNFISAENIANEINQGFNDLVVLVIIAPNGTRTLQLITSSEQAGLSANQLGSTNFVATMSGNYQFSWLVLNGGDSGKDSSLNITGISFNGGAYGIPVRLPINAALTDTDGSETLSVLISGIPAGAALSVGTNMGGGIWSLTGTQLNSVYLLPTVGYTGTLNLTVTATATETSNGNAITTASQSMQVEISSATNNITGTNSADTLNGTAGNDFIQGFDGNDTINGNAGNDLIYAGNGNDTVNGGDGNDIIYGEAGNDIINGGNGNDKIFGGAGSDTLTGGAGADIFAWQLGDQSSSSVPTDRITDFNRNQGDSLDLSALLQGESFNAGSLDQYLDFARVGSDTHITIRSTGATGAVDQIIILQGVDLTAGGTLSDQDILTQLLTSGALKVDGGP